MSDSLGPGILSPITLTAKEVAHHMKVLRHYRGVSANAEDTYKFLERQALRLSQREGQRQQKQIRDDLICFKREAEAAAVRRQVAVEELRLEESSPASPLTDAALRTAEEPPPLLSSPAQPTTAEEELRNLGRPLRSWRRWSEWTRPSRRDSTVAPVSQFLAGADTLGGLQESSSAFTEQESAAPVDLLLQKGGQEGPPSPVTLLPAAPVRDDASAALEGGEPPNQRTFVKSRRISYGRPPPSRKASLDIVQRTQEELQPEKPIAASHEEDVDLRTVILSDVETDVEVHCDNSWDTDTDVEGRSATRCTVYDAFDGLPHPFWGVHAEHSSWLSRPNPAKLDPELKILHILRALKPEARPKCNSALLVRHYKAFLKYGIVPDKLFELWSVTEAPAAYGVAESEEREARRRLPGSVPPEDAAESSTRDGAAASSVRREDDLLLPCPIDPTWRDVYSSRLRVLAPAKKKRRIAEFLRHLASSSSSSSDDDDKEEPLLKRKRESRRDV